jgi:hypothetical protein
MYACTTGAMCVKEAAKFSICFLVFNQNYTCACVLRIHMHICKCKSCSHDEILSFWFMFCRNGAKKASGFW